MDGASVNRKRLMRLKRRERGRVTGNKVQGNPGGFGVTCENMDVS